LQYATLNFDTFAEQLFPTLCCGATVVLRGEDIWDNNTFYNNLLHYGISVANLTPSMWYQLFKDFSAQGLTDFGRLRRMIVGGEAMPLDGLALWQQLGLTKAELWNFYGPTEATAASTSFCCNRYFNSDESIPATIPIGETLAGRYSYIVDNNLNILPSGSVGELVIGGELLARGYHQRPE
jgi:non-ribosomal peptide synthetase component F